MGKFLYLLARLQGARAILEIGTLGGYSTTWLARGLSRDGRLATLESNPRHAEVARANIARAGLADRVRLHEGRAIDSLPLITGPFDLIFIDADKPSSPDYLESALRLARRGGVIVMDNVVRDGAVLDSASSDASVVGVRRAMDRMRNEPRLCATAIQTIGLKGYDGFAIALVLGDDGR